MKYIDRTVISKYEPKTTDVMWVFPTENGETELRTFVNGKWKTVTDESDAYRKPQDGIPESDLSPAVKNTLDSADISAQIVNNKDHKPAQFSGLGRVNLAKNIQTIEGVEKNILTQDMFYKTVGSQRVPNTNTIFVIQYDYDLNDPNGENPITIPEGCVLKFDGGSLRNGSVNWNNTLVEGNVNLQNITVGTGKLSNDTVYVDWFNPYGDGEHDDSNTLVQVVKSLKSVGVTLFFGKNKTYLHGDGLDEVNGTGQQYNSLETYNTSTWQPSGKYSPDLGWFIAYNNHFGTSETPSPVDLGRDIRLMFEEMSNITIDGNGSSIISNENNGITKNNSVLWLYKCSNVVVKNLKIDGKKNERFNKLGVLYSDYNSGRGYVEWHNIRVIGCSNITFDNVVSDNACHNAFDVKYDYSDGSENKNISFVNCNAENAYKNGIGCNSCDGFVIQGGKYGNCGATYGTAPKANIDLEPEATKFINNILITNATFYWDLDKDLNVEGEVVINAGTKNTEIAGCDFINAGLTIAGSQNAKKSATAVSVKGCSFLNSIIWNRGDASTIESCSIIYNSEFIVYNGENVNHSQITPIITGPNTQFISNIVNWSSDLSIYTGYMSLSGVVNNNTFNNLCGSGNYIFRTFANQLNNNTFTDAGVDGKNGKLYGDYTPVAAGQNNIGKGILKSSQAIGLMTGPDYIGTAKAYLTRSLLLSSTDVAILFPDLSSNEVTTIKVGMYEKVNNVNTSTFIIYNSKNKNTSLGYETLTNGISNLVLKKGTAGIILDFSNVTFVGSRYVWISVEKDYIYPSFSNYNIYNVLDSVQLNELITAGSYSPILNCKTVGNTASRPTSSRLQIGFQFFDTTLGKPIYWNGTAWVDATGTVV